MRQFVWSASLIAALSACATPGERTAIGACGGAAVGAGVGAIAGGWGGAAIGALVGGGAGGALGNYPAKQAQGLETVAPAPRTPNRILVNLQSSPLLRSHS